MFRFQQTARASIRSLTHSAALATQKPSTLLRSFSAVSNALEPPVLVNKVLGVRELVLNRPQRLNALNGDMMKIISSKIKSWEDSELANIVVVKGAGRAVSAGADIRDVVEHLKKGNDQAMFYALKLEYEYLHQIATMKTPFVALMDGITMGAGGGLCAHGAFRVATENTVFAMPETAIGYFPDVGSSFFLSRLDGHLGTYLALTGESIKAEDVLFSGIATHFVPSSRLEALEARFAELDNADNEMVNNIIEEFAAEYDPNVRNTLSGEVRKTIDRCFKEHSVEDILAALEKDGSEFALKTRETLLKRSPLALKVTLEQMRTGANLGIAQCLKMEYKLMQQMTKEHDFTEGVTARLITRTEPKWNPSRLSDITDASVKARFFDKAPAMTLSFRSNQNFMMSPSRKYALPSEEDIRRIVTAEVPFSGQLTASAIEDYFVFERKGKFGVREKVREVLSRKTALVNKRNQEQLEWIYNH
ncbi:ClpP/crotonase-like domain-containing protein [Radiomyces spectabilis]|uniref:ClpP/crotonase-like domain-containing protein n=1 Tax=Radiomyces spectabilis TaxID=64574 RepID=UPI00221E70C2|nr:ClpP/crotonase-like domain-containing protein [Radiomyces spectabilis]KAI8393877.1 ClpP/crotonase-like domain-containing protein [Radiomyces spectabilis]